ncbi:MAG: twin-arginine translocase subunit TatC [Planctomycetia bacterium]|nr:twin-arginine translocase subunit TatC [Planctomycetia bacterium]
MSHIDEDDLFKESTMSFGEHLEELRTCLFRAILGLVVGFLIGLILGGKVVEVIQSPLRGALTQYYQGRAHTAIQKNKDDFQTRGYGTDVERLPQQYHLTAEKLLVNPVELAKVLGLDPTTLPKESPFLDQLASPEEEVTAASEEEKAWSVADYFSFEKWGTWISESLSEKGVDVTENVAVTAQETAENAVENAGPTELISLYVWRPSESDPRTQVKNFAVQETFMIYIKASLLAGVILSSPWVFWQIWSFIAAGLYPHERKYVHIFLPFSLGLFLGGAFLAFFFVFQPVLEFLFSFNSWMGIEPDPRISEWLNFFLILPIGFGISFQLPLVMLFLERIGIFSVHMYTSYWRISILGIFFISMILTPADPTSMVLMAIPLSFLYVGGIFLCKMMPRRKNPYAFEPKS